MPANTDPRMDVSKLLHALTLIAHTTPDSPARESVLEGAVWLDRYAAEGDDHDEALRMTREFTRNSVSALLGDDPRRLAFPVPPARPRPAVDTR